MFTLADLGAKTYDQVLKPAVAATGPPPVAAATKPPADCRTATGEAARQESILQFWRAVELFDAQTLDKPDPKERRYAPRAGEPLPWQVGHPLRRQQLGEDRVWRHTAFGGVFGRDRVHATLEQVFGPSGMDVDERTPRGDSALFAVVVTEDGRLLLDSLVLSTAGWAVGRAKQPGPSAPNWLDGFDTAAERHTAAVREAVAAAADDQVAATLAEDGIVVSRPVTHEELLALVDLTIGHLGVAHLLRPGGLRVHSEMVHRKRAHETQMDFLNSFVIEDLQRVGDAVADGDSGPALTSYLTGEEGLAVAARMNVRDPELDELVLEQLAPARVPAGRWPAKVTYPLASSQQLAINAGLEQLVDHAGVFAVNGPPGTGKTTMLRDLIAALVVARARRLADLRSPATGFTDQVVGWQSDTYTRRIRPLRPELTGFEMVVASANNGAVANVTREIPQVGAIDEAWAQEASYLPEHASRVLGDPAWGLIAAMLGNKSNRGDFVSRFWYGQPADRTKKPGDEGPGFLDYLKNVEATGTTAAWTAAVATFRAALTDEQQLREHRHTAHQALTRLPRLRQALNTSEIQVKAATAAWRTTDTAARTAAAAAATARQAADHTQQQRREHRAAKPGVWEILFTFGRAIRRWHAEDEDLASAVTTTEATAANALAQATSAHHTAAQAADHTAAATAERDRATALLTQTETTLDEAYRQYGEQVPDADWRANPERRQLAAPWLDERWNTARTRVFLAALGLHDAFITGAAKIMRANLHAAMDVLGGQAPRDVPEPALRAAWQSLFIVVPVISTTFASVSRLFGRLGRESLGWLLIDEAGQAAPQVAVGAIWRTKRVVAVGDPLQLEPVVTVLHTTQQALRRHHNVADTWLPGRTSVQVLADRITPIGTWLTRPDDCDVWVGAPLRVHRRCDNPMFDVVNTAVYDGLMIHGTPPRPHKLTVAESTWIDVNAVDSDGHWIPDEGRAAAEILTYLTRNNVDPTNILAISPFRDAARHLRRELGRTYPDLTCGTIHRAQGKEADAVLLVLGGNPSSEGARRWAASRPNLFNVAVSRAKQRLYVIGNHDSWAKLPYFSTLAQALPVRPLKTQTLREGQG